MKRTGWSYSLIDTQKISLSAQADCALVSQQTLSSIH